jgi:hypothetical protein
VCSTDIRAELAQRPEVDTVPIDVIPMLVRRSMDGA